MDNFTHEELEILESNLESITMGFSLSKDFNSGRLEMSATVHEQVGYEKTYKWLRQQMYYHAQQFKKDIANKYNFTEGGTIPQHRGA